MLDYRTRLINPESFKKKMNFLLIKIEDTESFTALCKVFPKAKIK